MAKYRCRLRGHGDVRAPRGRPRPQLGLGPRRHDGARQPDLLLLAGRAQPAGEHRPHQPRLLGRRGPERRQLPLQLVQRPALRRRRTDPGFIPDGQLCSGGNPNFSGFDLAHEDWPVTHLTSGAQIQFRYNKWAAHPGWFYLYVTKDGWNPNRPLTWADLEEQPFHTADHPQSVGSPGTNDAHYYWNATLPSGKSGRHLIYSVWKRSDSAETFYNCSDVVFDGGDGEVTGVGRPGPTPTVTPTVTPTGDTGSCTATYKTVTSWSGGFQGEVTVKNPGTAAVNGWTVNWDLAAGSSINSLWNGTHTVSGSTVTAKNADWNRTIQPGGSVTFGFTANGTSGSPTPACTSP
nr:hypothetical protein GCM10020093_051470 [Planobispora longispora]